MSKRMDEISLTDGTINRVAEEVIIAVFKRLKEKGTQCWADDFRALGILEVELLELKEAIHKNQFVREEWVDLAVTAVFAIVSNDHRCKQELPKKDEEPIGLTLGRAVLGRSFIGDKETNEDNTFPSTPENRGSLRSV